MTAKYRIKGDACVIDDILDEESFEGLGIGDYSASFDVKRIASHDPPDEESWDLTIEVSGRDENEFLAWCQKWLIDVEHIEEEAAAQ
jgi:hypothetical protein